MNKEIMNKSIKLLMCFLCYNLLLCSCNTTKKTNEQPSKDLKGVVIGYIPGDEYKEGQSKIRWEYLTHVNVSFLYIHADGSVDDSYVKQSLPLIVEKAHREGVKVLISLQSDSKNGFAQAIKSSEVRTRLIKEVVDYANRYGLDGIDVDYEIYDAVGPDLLLFISELYANKGEHLLQTCAVAQWNPTNQGGYTKEWHKYFDLINIMSYDNTGGWSTEGQHASYEQAIDGIRLWTQTLEAPPSKLVLGLPFYGYSWDDERIKNLGGSRAVRYSQLSAYYPEASIGETDQIGRTYYNGQATIRRKCQYAVENGLAGVMIWQLFQDSDVADTSLMEVIGQEMSQHVSAK